MPPAKHPQHIAVRIFNLLEDDRTGLDSLGIVDLFYGDQDKLI